MLDYKSRISGTGGTNNDYIYTHLVITEKELTQLKLENVKTSDLAEKIKVDFISVQRFGKVDFLHITDADNYDSIFSNGLFGNKENWIGDLGKGIYVIGEGNPIALDNLKSYVMDENYNVLILKGKYIGNYTECIYGEQHEGYLVLLTDEIPFKNIIGTEEITIEDFLFY